ncbi:MAG: macro domain-containing protein [Myxococcota bacterium]
MAIRYVHGDATAPVGDPPWVLVHIVNDKGGWGKGFVVAISRRWKAPERRYRAWSKGKEDLPFELGETQLVPVAEGCYVANLLGQVGMYARRGVPPIRYEAVRAGLQKVAEFALEENASVHMPRIGCGLAGGSWDEVGAIVEAELRNLDVTVYDYP